MPQSFLRYPLHASCELTWTFPESCDSVRTKIVDQINAWDVSNSIVNTAYSDCIGSVLDRGLPYDESRLHQASLRTEVPVQADQQRGGQCDGDAHHPCGQV